MPRFDEKNNYRFISRNCNAKIMQKFFNSINITTARPQKKSGFNQGQKYNQYYPEIM
jgi:hypothetical protein